MVDLVGMSMFGIHKKPSAMTFILHPYIPHPLVDPSATMETHPLILPTALAGGVSEITHTRGSGWLLLA